MAYTRKPRARKVFGKKKSYARNTTASFAKKVKSVINKVAETKSHITVQTEVNVNSLLSPVSATNIFALNVVTQGGGVSQRVGNKITPKFLNVRGSAHLSVEASTQFLRILVLEHDIGDDFTVDGLETDTAVYAPPGVDLAAIYGRLNTTRYKLLATKVIKLGHTQGFFGTQLFNMNMKLKGSMYFDQAGTVPAKRKISIIFFNRRSDADESLGTNCEITFNSKFYFTDM